MSLTPEQFCYWLNGFIELHGQPPTPAQWESIKEHLALVFTKVTGTRANEWRIAPSSLPLGSPDGAIGISAQPGGPGQKTYCASASTGERLCTDSTLKILDLVCSGPICGTTTTGC